ncbi:MAG: glycosyl transferase [Planctomycetota bacterium]|nr:MAG: glycosyl transferase [Planctomycetota bacterium]
MAAGPRAGRPRVHGAARAAEEFMEASQAVIPNEIERGRSGPPVLSIIIPVFNEVNTVRQVIEKVRAVPFPDPFEILVVNDGSTDGSEQVLRELPAWEDVRVLHHARNAGKGAAVQTALREIRGQYVVIQDADLELNPHDMLPLYEKVRGGAPVCYGSRFMGDNRRLHGRSTYWANRMLNMTCNLVNGIRLTDMNTCYKMMRADVARRLHLQSRGFAMEPEITTKLARLKVPIEELPISYIPREKSEGKKIRAMDFFRYLRAMGRYRFSSFDTGSADVQPPAQGSSSHPA